MKVVSLLSNKGGAGKTTLSINLAIAAVLDGKQVALIDLDPQGSAASWGDSREDEAPAVVSIQPSRLDKVLEAAQDSGADLAVIDTAPHSEAAALQSARASELCLVPVRPAILDLRAINFTIDMLNLTKAKGAIVLNAVPTAGLAIDAEAALKEIGVPLVPVKLAQRVAYMHALTMGQGVQEYESSGKAALEVLQLYKWVKQQVDL